MFTVLMLTLPLLTTIISTSKLTAETFSRFSPAKATILQGDLSKIDVTYDVIPLHRSTRILNRSSRDWGGEFLKVVTDTSLHEPLGVVLSNGPHGTSCARLWRQTVSNAFVRSESQPPSILLSTILQNGTNSIVYCQSYRHFLTTLMTSSLESPNSTRDTLASMLTLLQLLPQGSSLTLFTDEIDVEDRGSLSEKILRTALHKSCKVNIFVCQDKTEKVLLDERHTPWENLTMKTKGKLFWMDASAEPATEEVTLLDRRGLTGTSRIPIRIDSSILQLHVQMSGKVQRATLSNDDNDSQSIDLFALQSHAFPPSVPSSAATSHHLSSLSGTRTRNLEPSQNPVPRPHSGNEREFQGHGTELDVYVPVIDSLGAGRTTWILNARGVAYDVQLRAVVIGSGSTQDDLRVFSTDVPVNNSGFESEGGGHKIQSRSDTMVDASESVRISGQARPEFRRAGTSGSGGGNDRNGFMWPELHLLGGGFHDRPWTTLGADYNGVMMGTPGQLSMIPLSPISLEVNQGSSLTALPGETVQIMFDLANNFQRPVKFFFSARDQFQYVRNVHPTMRWVDPYESVRVTVWLEAQGSEGTTDVVSLTAVGLEPITRNVYMHIGREVYDNTRPDITYSWKGDCENALTPDTCARASWGIEAVVQDTESGLLKVTSKPFPLRFRSNFVAGTREPVKVQYISSCCFLKLDLIASDVKGNVNKYTINVENRWLSWSQILSIVFGSILLIILLALIVYAIARCIQVRRKRNFLGE